MVLGGKVWNTLGHDDRKLLIIAIHPDSSRMIVDLESKRLWDDLLPSTQKDLLGVDWSMMLDRDVRPDSW